MALWTLADLHLSTAVPKEMDIFGGRWQGYMEKIVKNWRALISQEDVVVLGGDISWGISLKESEHDFLLLESLPGKKIIVKGNHDLWWETVTKMNRFLDAIGVQSIEFLHNNAFMYENIAICGTRGWPFEEDFSDPHNEKIFRRELLRLERSLKAGRKQNPDEIICFLHHPPLYVNYCCEEIIALMQTYGVKKCVYGHLHGYSLQYAIEGESRGIDWVLASGDHVNFVPILLKK